MQNYVINFISDLQQVVVSSWYSGVLHQYNCPPRNNYILLKVALNTIVLPSICNMNNKNSDNCTICLFNEYEGIT